MPAHIPEAPEPTEPKWHGVVFGAISDTQVADAILRVTVDIPIPEFRAVQLGWGQPGDEGFVASMLQGAANGTNLKQAHVTWEVL